MPISTYQDAQHHQMRKPWYIYTMEYYSAIKKNTFESVLMRWMKLEPIIQSEVSQKDKHQYSILKHINGIQKDGNDNPICRQKKRHRYIEQTFGLYGRRWGWDDLREQHQNIYYQVWNRSSWIQIQIQIQWKQIQKQSRLDAWDKCSGLVHWDDPEGRDGEGRGSGFRMGNTCKSMADSCQCMAKTTKKCLK